TVRRACAKMRCAAGIGPPDVVKAPCLVRGALGGNPLSGGSTDAVLRLHSGRYSRPDNQPGDLVAQREIERRVSGGRRGAPGPKIVDAGPHNVYHVTHPPRLTDAL